MIDNLTYTLDGNRPTRIDDGATAAAYNGGSEFKDGVKQANEYAYDANGNLTKDLNKNISNIQYNCLNLPSAVTFADGSTITYTYAADGTKLRVVHKIGSTTTTTDYCGNVVYENGTPKHLLTEEGYVTLADKKYHYFLQDHQGNNRVVVDAAGTVEEVNHYYPFGGTFASTSVQPYKYNGKEYDDKKGLNWYDYGARHYDAAIGRFTTKDRFAEKYYAMSPYQYGANNPIENIDVNGDSITILNYGYNEKQHMAMLIQNETGKWQYYSINGDNFYISGKFSGGRKFDDIAVGEFNSPQEFMESSYNSSGKEYDLSINSYGFVEGYVLPSTPKQDEIMRKYFDDISKNEEYDLLKNNCTTIVQRVIESVGFKTYERERVLRILPAIPSMGIPSIKISLNRPRPIVPSISFKSIIKQNPYGMMIYRRVP